MIHIADSSIPILSSTLTHFTSTGFGTNSWKLHLPNLSRWILYQARKSSPKDQYMTIWIETGPRLVFWWQSMGNYIILWIAPTLIIEFGRWDISENPLDAWSRVRFVIPFESWSQRWQISSRILEIAIYASHIEPPGRYINSCCLSHAKRETRFRK